MPKVVIVELLQELQQEKPRPPFAGRLEYREDGDLPTYPSMKYHHLL